MRRGILGIIAVAAVMVATHVGDELVPLVRAQQRGQSGSVSPQDDLAAAKKQIGDLTARLSAIEERVKGVGTSSLQLSLDVMGLKRQNKVAWLDAASPGQYRRIDSEAGLFLVTLQDATPYLDGYRVSLRIGNLTSARYVGFKLDTTWGPRFDRDKYNEAQYQRWDSQKQSKEFQFSDALLPGTWNRVDLILPATSASQLAFIALEMTTDTVSLGSGR